MSNASVSSGITRDRDSSRVFLGSTFLHSYLIVGTHFCLFFALESLESLLGFELDSIFYNELLIIN